MDTCNRYKDFTVRVSTNGGGGGGEAERKHHYKCRKKYISQKELERPGFQTTKLGGGIRNNARVDQVGETYPYSILRDSTHSCLCAPISGTAARKQDKVSS